MKKLILLLIFATSIVFSQTTTTTVGSLKINNIPTTVSGNTKQLVRNPITKIVEEQVIANGNPFTLNQTNAITGGNTPSGTNVFATMLDLSLKNPLLNGNGRVVQNGLTTTYDNSLLVTSVNGQTGAVNINTGLGLINTTTGNDTDSSFIFENSQFKSSLQDRYIEFVRKETNTISGSLTTRIFGASDTNTNMPGNVLRNFILPSIPGGGFLAVTSDLLTKQNILNGTGFVKQNGNITTYEDINLSLKQDKLNGTGLVRQDGLITTYDNNTYITDTSSFIQNYFINPSSQSIGFAEFEGIIYNNGHNLMEDGFYNGITNTTNQWPTTNGKFATVNDIPAQVGTNVTYAPSLRQINSSTGTGAILPIATTTDAGLMSNTDKIKLNDLSTNATLQDNLLGKVPYDGAQFPVDLGLQNLTAKNITATNIILASNLSGTNTGDNATNNQYNGLQSSKQDLLISGTNIKTINGTSILGSGNIAISTIDNTKLAIANNLSDLANAATARNNLGLGVLATSNATIPTNTNQLINGNGFITGISSANVTTALGFTPYNVTNPNGFISSVPAQTFASLTSKPTTLSGYGITDAYPLAGNPSGFLVSSALTPYLTSATASTTYQPLGSYLTSFTETDPTVKAINGIVKSNGTTISAAISGTDYLLPNGSASQLTNFPILNQNTTGTASNITGNLPQVQVVNLVTDLAAKQNTLIPGTNVTILGNTINVPSAPASVVGTRIYRNANQSIPVSGLFTDLAFTTYGNFQDTNWGTPSTSQVCPESGKYIINVEATFNGAGLVSTATCNLQILVNGIVFGKDEIQVALNSLGSLKTTAYRFLNAGDIVSVQVKHNNSTAMDVLVQGDHSPDIFLSKQGGAQGLAGTNQLLQIFTINGTYTKPDGAKSVEVTVIGAGAGGGSGRKGANATVRCGGGAGGAGGVSKNVFLADDIDATVPITIGLGGLGGVSQQTNSTNGVNGSAGQNSFFGKYLKSNSGNQGSGGTLTTGSGGISGTGVTYLGLSAPSASTTGGSGGNASATNYSSLTGASGGGITTGNVASVGGNANITPNFSGVIPGLVSNGGAISTNALNGFTPISKDFGFGGGGGGSSITTNGGNGGNGSGFGSGGGGGGASTDAVGNSGKGGDGMPGIVIVKTNF